MDILSWHNWTTPPPPAYIGPYLPPPLFWGHELQKKKVSGRFETVAGRYDPSKLLKIGYPNRVTSSPKIASKSKNSALYVTKPTHTPYHCLPLDPFLTLLPH